VQFAFQQQALQPALVQVREPLHLEVEAKRLAHDALTQISLLLGAVVLCQLLASYSGELRFNPVLEFYVHLHQLSLFPQQTFSLQSQQLLPFLEVL